jgi:hypothetical protein
MKRFSQFLLEFRGSRASEKAYRLGLVSDGHGNWVDRSGKVVAQTVGGDLEMIRKKSPSPEKPEPGPTGPRTPQRVVEPPPDPAERKGISPPKEEPAPPEIEQDLPLTIVFAKFNPPSVKHEKLIKKAQEIAAGGELRIYPSRMQDNQRNPLDPASKIKYMRKMFPEIKDNIINDKDMNTIFDVLTAANEDGYDKVNIVAGLDRVSEFERLSGQHNGKLYNFDEINVIPSGPIDPDSESSSSSLRKAAIENNYNKFKIGIPKRIKDKDAQALFFAVQRSMLDGGQPEQKEPQDIAEIWRYAPEFDLTTLREQYYRENIFKIGEKVQNLNTGLVGEVIRRGPNYLICVTEDNIMFKSWIKDLTEWTDVSGVPASQREVGTDAFREYAMKMTGTKTIKNFIQKYKRSIEK